MRRSSALWWCRRRCACSATSTGGRRDRWRDCNDASASRSRQPNSRAVWSPPVGWAIVQAVQAPMLRPLGVGDVLDRTFTVYLSKPLIFIGLSAIWYLLLFIVFVLLAAVIFAGALSVFARQTATPSPELAAGAIVGVVGLGL